MPRRPPGASTLAPSAAGPRDHASALAQRLLPTRIASRITGRIARLQRPWLKDPLIRAFTRCCAIALEEADPSTPEAYPSLNALFTRALRPGSRPLPADPAALASPCDGTVSAVGVLEKDQLLQAKRHRYTAEELLAGDARAFHGGSFLTLYLAPDDYHRIHMPLRGRLVAERHVPGRLLSVSPRLTRAIPRLFARNERLVTHWKTSLGPMAIVAVGALNVGSIETVWRGVAGTREGAAHEYPSGAGPELQRGEELGRFNLGSTVVLLLPPNAARWNEHLEPGCKLRMGEAVGVAE